MNLVKFHISLPEEPFMIRVLNFIGPIKLHVGRHTRNKYILGTTNYATKCVEARALRMNIVVMIDIFI
jgi:hypothetical protein